MSDNYSVTIRDTSRELTLRERIRIKDTGCCVKMEDILSAGEKLEIPFDGYAMLDVHNEKANPVDYENIVVFAKDGTCYRTGSPTFIRTFLDIYSEICDYPGEEYSIGAVYQESKNYKGKNFIRAILL